MIFWLGLVYVFSMLAYHKYDGSVVNGGDSWGYYAYLPAKIIHQDLWSLDSTINIRQKLVPNSVYTDSQGRLVAEEAPFRGENRIIKYTCGVAILNVIAFDLAHVYCLIFSPDLANGFSKPYIFALYLNTILFILLGFYFLQKSLKHYFSNVLCNLCLLSIALATNLYYFACINNVMAHPYLFFLWSGLIYASILFWETKKIKFGIIIGLLCGMITLIRPVEIICLLIPVLWGVGSLAEFNARFQELIREIKAVLAAGFMFVLPIFPQLFYWKKVSGSWLYYSYGGEGFDFGSPEILRGMFGFMNGWIIYSLVMLFSLIGIPLLWRYKRNIAIVVSLIFILHIYITFSWWNWYYINGFGSRPMVDIYALLAFPLAAFFRWVLSRNGIRWLIFVLLPLLITLNMFQVWQHSKGILWTELGNPAYYFQSFGKNVFDQKMSIALDLNNFQYDMTPYKTLWSTSFDEPQDSIYLRTDELKVSSPSSLFLHTKDQNRTLVSIPVDECNIHKGDYFSLNLAVYVKNQMSDFWKFTTLVIDHKRGDRIYKRQYLRLHNKPILPDGSNNIWWGQPQKWHEIRAFVRPSTRIRSGDYIEFHFNVEPGATPIYIDDVSIGLAHMTK